MKSLFIFFIIAVSSALGMTIRPERQSQAEDTNDLEDRYGGQHRHIVGHQWNQWPSQNRFPGLNQFSTSSPTNNGGSTTPTSASRQCISQCRVTAEYNPVCGTDLVQYSNPGRLACAQACGVNVSFLRVAPCPTTTTAAPN